MSPRHISQLDWSELSPDAKLESLKKRVDGHDRDITDIVSGEDMRNARQNEAYTTAMNEAIRQIQLTTASQKKKIDDIHAQSLESGLERERRKRRSGPERIAFITTCGIVISAAIAAIASNCNGGHQIEHPSFTEKKE